MRVLSASPFRTSIFRLTALYAALFVVSVGILFGVVGYVTRTSMRAQISATVQREAASLAYEYEATRGSGAADLIARRLQRGAQSYFLLQDAAGKPIAGNIDPVAPVPGLLPHLVVRPRPDAAEARSGGEREAHDAIAFGVKLADGTFVLVGNDLERVTQLESAIGKAFAVGGGVSALLAILGGLALSVSFVRRLEAVNRTSREIMSGRLEARIPVLNRNDELDRLAVNLNTMFDRIQSLMESLKQVSSNVAHDLRTPLSRLRQTLELARISATNVDEFRASTDAAIEEAENLLQIFSGLLRIAQIESGSRKAGFADIDLSSLLDLVAETYGVVAEDAAHEMTAHVEPGITIRGDRELLLQLSANLVENAIRHTPEGARIEIGLCRRADCVVAFFADNGQGIPASEHEKVFRRFYRLEASRTTPGNGLGLALVAAVADLHGADVRLSDNRPGLRVEVRFPPACCAVA